MFLHSFQMRGRCCRTGTGPAQHHQLGREPRLLAQGLTERPHWTLSPWDLLFSEAHPFFRGVSPRGALFPRGGGCRAPADSGLSNLFGGGTSLKPVYYGRPPLRGLRVAIPVFLPWFLGEQSRPFPLSSFHVELQLPCVPTAYLLSPLLPGTLREPGPHSPPPRGNLLLPQDEPNLHTEL